MTCPCDPARAFFFILADFKMRDIAVNILAGSIPDVGEEKHIADQGKEAHNA
jgi:hypothetical protein